jgi:hypothetical protein
VSLITNISNWLISQKESPKANKQFLNWSQLSEVLIIAYDNQLANVVEFINACKKDNINIRVAVIYDGKPEQAPKPHFDHVILDGKQFSFFRIPNEEAISKLVTKPLDVLINLGSAAQNKAFALSKLVPAKCKISSFQDPVFDISIDGDKNLGSSDYLKQVIVYLNMIKTTIK